MSFYYHPRMLAYDFGPAHPLRPERLRRTIELLQRCSPLEILDPGVGDEIDVLRVHGERYLDTVKGLSAGGSVDAEEVFSAGFASGDNPPFLGMHEAALAYCSGSAAAARDVAGGAPLAISLSGGLHHARRSQASGFCIYNDPAIAISILKERFGKVAYIDIDVHHGDGVQWLFYDDPTVLTCSIHQSGRTLYPGTGGVEETGAGHSSINVPLAPNTTGDVWLSAFKRGILTAITQFQPEAIVFQMGTDAHFSDPLAQLLVTAREWLEAVHLVKKLRTPLVALGGGGYNLSAVPRMWTAAVLTLLDKPIPAMPDDLAKAWDMPSFFDENLPLPRRQGAAEAETVLGALHSSCSAMP